MQRCDNCGEARGWKEHDSSVLCAKCKRKAET